MKKRFGGCHNGFHDLCFVCAHARARARVCVCVCVRERRKIKLTVWGKKCPFPLMGFEPVPLGYAPIVPPITPRGQARLRQSKQTLQRCMLHSIVWRRGEKHWMCCILTGKGDKKKKPKLAFWWNFVSVKRRPLSFCFFFFFFFFF